jgi:hypothetical protein
MHWMAARILLLGRREECVLLAYLQLLYVLQSYHVDPLQIMFWEYEAHAQRDVTVITICYNPRSFHVFCPGKSSPISRTYMVKKVKLSLNRLWRPTGLRHQGPHILQMVGSQMVVRLSALHAGRPLTPGRFLVRISVRGWVDPRALVTLQGLGQLKNPMTSGIEPMTLQFVA